MSFFKNLTIFIRFQLSFMPKFGHFFSNFPIFTQNPLILLDNFPKPPQRAHKFLISPLPSHYIQIPPLLAFLLPLPMKVFGITKINILFFPCLPSFSLMSFLLDECLDLLFWTRKQRQRAMSFSVRFYFPSAVTPFGNEGQTHLLLSKRGIVWFLSHCFDVVIDVITNKL